MASDDPGRRLSKKTVKKTCTEDLFSETNLLKCRCEASG